jgi:ABC-2 type transport system ATP-binding protein
MVVKIENLHKTYKNKVKALNNLSFQVRDGEIFGLLGPNGSGKTTCINCMLALLKYEEGTIEIFNQPMTATSYDIKRNIGVITQNVAVFNVLTVWENIDYFCGLYVADKEERHKLVEEAIQFVALDEFRNFYPHKLSGGLLRRLHIACGIAHKPKLIILDEPTVGVDPQSRNKILEGIKKLNQEGATIIYTSHYMEEVEFLCDYILIMDKGKVIAEGSKEEIKSMIDLGETIEIELTEPNEDIIQEIQKINNVNKVYYKDKLLVVKSGKGKTNIPAVLEILNKHQLEYEKIYSELPTLNDVFLEITGKVVMYADNITASMEKAIAETYRRRAIQEEYNKKHGIVPQTIVKAIGEGISIIQEDVKENLIVGDKNLSDFEKRKLIESLEVKMKQAAKELNFEEAMALRDAIFELKAELDK